MYYNDAKPDKIFYAALAYRRMAELETGHGTARTEESEKLQGKANGLC